MNEITANSGIRFSIITSCFNSYATLLETYRSLEAQTYRNFEWILIDDASTDGEKTKQLIESIQNTANFQVKKKYLDKNYFGSKSTFTACEMAEGKYIAILDHDDQLMPKCLEYVNRKIFELDPTSRLAGIAGRCVTTHGKLIGKTFKQDTFIANEGDVRFKQQITCELFQFTKKDVAMPFFKLMKPG